MAEFAIQEWGVVGVIIVLFAGQLVFLQKTLMNKLKQNMDITIKLIDRFNRSDEAADRRSEKVIESADRRHDILIREIDDLSDTTRSSLEYLKGRINGKNQ